MLVQGTAEKQLLLMLSPCLNNIKKKKKTGPDGLSACFLKEIATEIAEPLTALYVTGFWKNDPNRTLEVSRINGFKELKPA